MPARYMVRYDLCRVRITHSLSFHFWPKECNLLTHSLPVWHQPGHTAEMVMPPLVSRSSSDSSLVALLSIALLILCTANASVVNVASVHPTAAAAVAQNKRTARSPDQVPNIPTRVAADSRPHSACSMMRQDASPVLPVNWHADAWVPWLHCF